MKVLLLGGGTGPEREISLRMSKSVEEALRELHYDYVFVDPADGDEAVIADAQGCEVALPMIPGVSGEDGTIQRVLERAGIPYLGGDVETSELCFDKARFIDLLRRNGITVPAGEVVNTETFSKSELINKPFVLKPIADGSTIGVLIVRELPYDKVKVQELFRKYGKMLLEELIEGIEITVPVLGDTALPVIEIIPPSGEEFDYDNKYNGKSQEVVPPRNVDEATQRKVQALAERIHKLAGLRHLSRTDMIIDKQGQPYVLETNTIPGLTSQSLFPKAAKVAGYSWPQLIAKFVELAKSN